MLGWPLLIDRQLEFAWWARFGAPRDYDDDGIFESKHEGLDLYAEVGDDVIACEDGIVVWASDQRRGIGGDSLLGNHIIIEHDNGLITWSGHLDNMLSGVGDVVLKGETIGYAGSSGRSTGPHLHLIVQDPGNGRTGFKIRDVVDPLEYLE